MPIFLENNFVISIVDENTVALSSNKQILTERIYDVNCDVKTHAREY